MMLKTNLNDTQMENKHSCITKISKPEFWGVSYPLSLK